jgi:hypothetical protein
MGQVEVRFRLPSYALLIPVQASCPLRGLHGRRVELLGLIAPCPTWHVRTDGGMVARPAILPVVWRHVSVWHSCWQGQRRELLLASELLLAPARFLSVHLIAHREAGGRRAPGRCIFKRLEQIAPHYCNGRATSVAVHELHQSVEVQYQPGYHFFISIWNRVFYKFLLGFLSSFF